MAENVAAGTADNFTILTEKHKFISSTADVGRRDFSVGWHEYIKLLKV
jgi:hypothetical protein